MHLTPIPTRAAAAPRDGPRLLPVRHGLERRALVLGAAALLFPVVFVLARIDAEVTSAVSLLYVVPVALVALELGLRRGLAAAGLAFVLLVVWSVTTDAGLDAVGYLTRLVALAAVGGLAGRFSDRMRAAQRRQAGLLRSGIALARLEAGASPARILAEAALDTVGARGVRVTLDGSAPFVAGRCSGSPLAVPLDAGGGRIGTIEAYGIRRGDEPDDEAALRMLAVQAAVAAENRRLMDVERDRAALHAELERMRFHLDDQRGQLERVLDLEEQERRRVALELQEEAAQALAGVLLGLGALERDAERPPPRAALEPLRFHVHATLQTLRRLAADLRPPVLDQLGLQAALEALAQRAPEGAPPAVVVEVPVAGRRLAPGVETAAYRIVEETLGVLGGPAEVRVAYEPQAERVLVSVGVPGAAACGACEGDPEVRNARLAAVRARVELLGGLLGVISTPGGGIVLRAILPAAPTTARHGGDERRQVS